jgi:hypothetical protein
MKVAFSLKKMPAACEKRARPVGEPLARGKHPRHVVTKSFTKANRTAPAIADPFRAVRKVVDFRFDPCYEARRDDLLEARLMATARIGGATKAMEGHLPERKKSVRPTLRLKNGSEVDARKAYVYWHTLQGLEIGRRDHLQAFVMLARGDEPVARGQTRDDLRRLYLTEFARDGSLDPIFREVVLSAFRETAEGAVVVNPFQLTSQADIDVFTKVSLQVLREMQRLFRLMRGEDKPPGQAR